MNKNILRMVFVGLLLVTSASIPLYAQEPIGKVISLKGSAEAQLGEDGQWRLLSVKSDIYEKDTIRTAEDSQVILFFVDETNVSIGPETTIKIETLIYSPAQNRREGKLNVMAGKARFDVGKLFSKDSSFEVRTPTAVAGVKGTSFIVHVTSEQLTQLIGLSGVVTVTGIGVEGESLLTGGVIITVEDGSPPGDPVPISFDELLEFLQELGLLDGNGGNGAGGNFGGNMLLNNLGNFNPPGGQNIINQPLEGPPEEDDELPEPPKPPTEPDESPDDDIMR